MANPIQPNDPSVPVPGMAVPEPGILNVDDLAAAAAGDCGCPPQGNDPATGAGPSGVVRQEPEDNEGPRAMIEAWTKRVQASRAHWQAKFRQMREDQAFARGRQWPGQDEDDDRYVANIVQRHIQSRTDALYAKNPRFVARRRKQLDFKLWDENPQNALMAMQGIFNSQNTQATTGMPPSPQQAQAMQQAQALLADIQQGAQNRKIKQKIADTMEILMQYEVSTQNPPFKKQMKQLVRRTLTTSVGWLKLGFERAMEPRPDDVEKIRDYTTQITELERQLADMQDDVQRGPTELQLQELKDQLAAVQEAPGIIVREGLVFDFPPSPSIIVDKRCRQLQGFVGARFIAQEFNLPPTEVERIYKVDVKEAGFTPFNGDGTRNDPMPGTDGSVARAVSVYNDESLVRVYEIQDKQTRQVFTIAEGCPVYLKAPASPEVEIDRFWTLFCLIFNEVDDEDQIYPPSDVELLRPMQLEHNRARQALREHRKANEPGYVSPRGTLTDDDKALLSTHNPHETVELDGLAPNQKVADVIQEIPKQSIDPNLYEVKSVFDDVLKVVGQQEANIGGTSGATATETSIAEGSRLASVASNVDDFDDFFNEFAAAAGQILLKEFDSATVAKIAGPGAVWPELSAQDIADELILEIEAGSSGKPNKAVDIQNYQQLAPILMQIPGISPEWLAREGIRRMDDKMDLTDAFIAGMPSIAAQNAAKQIQQGAGTGAQTDPAAQGPQGAQNSPKPAPAEQPNMHPAPDQAVPNPGGFVPPPP